MSSTGFNGGRFAELLLGVRINTTILFMAHVCKKDEVGATIWYRTRGALISREVDTMALQGPLRNLDHPN